jgi:hypothetical protein
MQGEGVSFSGTGSAADPLTINAHAATKIIVVDTSTVNLTVTGVGSADDPYVLTGVTNPGGTPRLTMQRFNTSGVWTRPVDRQLALVTVVGGGGGGMAGGRNNTNSRGGTGGAGGGWSQFLFRVSDLPTTVDVTVGAGGKGGDPATVATTVGQNGVAGGQSMFGTRLRANGGGGGTTSAPLGGWGTQAGGAGVIAGSAHPSPSLLSPRGGGYGGSYNHGSYPTTALAGAPLRTRMVTGGAAGAGRANGGEGKSTYDSGSGGGGGGVGASNAPAGSGGKGGLGAGGGGGGATSAAYASGAGGDGGDGVVVVVTW